jgi:putative membrane protein
MPQNIFISILNVLKTKEKRLYTASARVFCLDRKYYITSGMNDELKGDRKMSTDSSKLASLKTYMLIAFIFNIIAIIAFALYGIWDIYVGATWTSVLDYWGYASGWGTTTIIVGVVMLVFAGLAAWIFLTRVNPMYKAVNTGNVATLKSLNNMMWAILALIFAGVLPGIMLLISFGPINELGQGPPPPPPT